ncbi:AAA family ATPase [Patescibacteria group bacterium]|nr:AAA family ATPase [Patescibacteria group bacterium]
MKFVKFEIENFKGIKELSLDFAKIPSGKIFPLVGLNESGKTTILEALDLFQRGQKSGLEHKLLHKARAGFFSGKVEVRAVLELDENDQNIIENLIVGENYEIRNKVEKVTVIKAYNFSNSEFEGFDTSWILPYFIKRRQAANFIKLFDKDLDLWRKITDTIEQSLIPKILYFSDFLFKFPEQIYLENIDLLALSDEDKNNLKEYRKVVDDVLRSINPSYNLSDFLTKVKSVGDPAKQSAAAKIKNDIAKELKRRILEPWLNIFPGTRKDILVDITLDATGTFMEIKIDDGGSPFHVHERSLGFRWFFGFILFTEFRKARDGESGEYLFLFDEPASNLHQSSQIKLLSIFRNLVDSAKIIYSTHSHYLLSIDFLSNAFVVKDEGRNEEDIYNYQQDIKALPYRSFVSDSENEETHIKPILDILEYVESPLAPSNQVVFLEGKWDYYTFKWIKSKFFKEKDYDFVFYPGASVDKYDRIFREYLANNRKFIAIFDGDEAGEEAKARYLEKISEELTNNLFTLEDINSSFSGLKTENLFLKKKTDEKLNIQQVTYPKDTTYNKTHFNKSIENLFINDQDFQIMKSTRNNFETVLDFIQQKFDELNN